MAAFQRVLSEAGLAQKQNCLRIFAAVGKKLGKVLINAVDGCAVIAIAKYFHGRQWGRSLPVMVSFADVQGIAEVQRAFPESSSRQMNAFQSLSQNADAEPRR